MSTDAVPLESPLATAACLRIIAAIVFGAILVQVLSEALLGWEDPEGPPWADVLSPTAFFFVLVAGLATQCLAITLIHRAPTVAVVLTFTLHVTLAVGLDSPLWLEPANLAVAVAVFFMAERGAHVRTVAVVTAMVCVLLVLQWHRVAHASGEPASRWGVHEIHAALQLTPLVAASLLGGIWGIESRKVAAARRASAVAPLENERRIAQAERERIAQELHDVAAQHLSGLLTLANAAVDLADDDPRTAVSLITEVRKEGRFAVASIYGALGELRSGGADHLEPTPDAQQLDRLVEQWRTRGMSVEVLALGNLTALPAVVSVTTYRVVQEALANAAKHAPGAPVRVRVLADVAHLKVTVENGAPTRSASASDDRIGLGWGLPGLRERLSLLDGVLSAGPTPDGGWRVSAELPLPHVETTTPPPRWAP